MKQAKFFAAAMLIAMISSFVFAQSARSETTAEDDYLSSFEDMIITELTASDEYDNKMLALQYIEEALDRDVDGRDLTQIQSALDSLAGEGVITQTRSNGRLVNNFPDVRAKACEMLAKMNNEQAKDTLVKIALADNEPMVASAAIKSIGSIEQEETDDAVNTIAWVEKKYAILNPTSSLAFEILNAYEKLAPNLKDKGPLIQSISKIAVNYNYVTPVRDKAKELLRTYTGKKVN